MARILSKLNRELASARSIPLYKDQEERLKEIIALMKEKSIKAPTITEFTRLGMDLILDKLEDELKDEK